MSRELIADTEMGHRRLRTQEEAMSKLIVDSTAAYRGQIELEENAENAEKAGDVPEAENCRCWARALTPASKGGEAIEVSVPKGTSVCGACGYPRGTTIVGGSRGMPYWKRGDGDERAETMSLTELHLTHGAYDKAKDKLAVVSTYIELHDHFASQALVGLLQHEWVEPRTGRQLPLYDAAEATELAYRYADAMLEERDKEKP